MAPDDVRSRFAPVAANYTRTAFHASKERLQEVIDLAEPKPGFVVLDVATGTGNTAFALAPFVRWVTGLDLTPEMLEQARRLTAERAVRNVDWVLGDAAHLPFDDATFDLYTVRAAPHHFADVAAFLSEALRVLKSGGAAVIVDCSPPEAARDSLHTVEVRRDPSHVRSLTVEEWRQRLEAVGFAVEIATRRELDWDFDDWMRTMAVDPQLAAELGGVIEGTTGEAFQQLHPERRQGRLWHAYWHCLIRARKPA